MKTWTFVLLATMACGATESSSQSQDEAITGEREVNAPDGGSQKAGCPNEAVNPFLGKWQGSAILAPAQGEPVKQPKSVDEFIKGECRDFTATIQYYDESDNPTRKIRFVATATPNDPSTFKIDGQVTDGDAAPLPMIGSVRAVEQGTFLATFQTAFGGKPAYFTELINVVGGPDGSGKTLTRTIQMFAGKKGGPYLASRVAKETPLVE